MQQAASVLVINFNYRDPYIYTLQERPRKIFLEILPKWLGMAPPKAKVEKGYNFNPDEFNSMRNPENNNGMDSRIEEILAISEEGSYILPGEEQMIDGVDDATNRDIHNNTVYGGKSAKSDIPWTKLAKTHQAALAYGISTRGPGGGRNNRPGLKKRLSSTASDGLTGITRHVDNQDPNRHALRRILKSKQNKPLWKKNFLKFINDQERCKSHYHINTYTDNIQKLSEVRSERDDWIYLGMVIDRLLLYFFL